MNFAKEPTGIGEPKDEHLMEVRLTDMYFQLKQSSIPLKPNQFVIGVDYKDREKVLKGTELVNLSFWNPHPKGVADQLAKDFLITKLSTL